MISRLICEIIFTNKNEQTLTINSAASVEVRSSWRTLTNTATIVLPRKLGKLASSRIGELVKVGDKVKIDLGYDVTLRTEFVGYVSAISATSPIEIKCEDAMWLLKQKASIKTGAVNAWKQATLAGIAARLLGGEISVNAANVSLGAYRLTEKTVAKELEKLKEVLPLASPYFRYTDGVETLFIGQRYPIEWLGRQDRRVVFHFQRNVIDHRLEWKSKEDRKILAKAIIKMPNGKDTIMEVGDADGEVHTLHYYNLTEAVARQHIEEDLARMRYDGFSGKLTSFGEPYCEHGYTAQLIDDEYPEKNGTYFIDEVVVRWGTDGYRREIELGKKAS